LNPLQLSFYRGLHYNADKRIVTNATGKNQYNEVTAQNERKAQEDDFNSLKPWEIQFSKMTNEFRHMLRDYVKADDTESVRSTLKQYIGMLEDLYESI